MMYLDLANVEATERLGACFAKALKAPSLIFLHGELGAGKTSFVRGLMRQFGHRGAVKSPTYTLIERYCLDGTVLYHLDFYRLKALEEFEYLGLDELFAEPAMVLIEWPEVAEALLPAADFSLKFSYTEAGRRVEIHPEQHSIEECFLA